MITLAYITCRLNPRWEWFIESLCAQTTSEQRENLELLFIDGRLWLDGTPPPMSSVLLASRAYHKTDRDIEIVHHLKRRFPHVQNIPPKPTAYQGPWRQTKLDLFCAGNTRNTAFIVAKGDYVVFVDDLSVLMPGWFNQVLHAAEGGYIVAGMYKKVRGLRADGTYDSIASTDSRWEHGSDQGVVPWHGGAMYGCSFGLPLEAALEVDGNDAACCGQGFEDYEFGMRLERASWPIFLNRNMLTLEDEDLHHDGSTMPRERKIVAPECLPKNYDSYRYVREDEKYWSDHVMLNRLINEPDRFLPLIGDNLRVLRKRYQETGLVPCPPPDMLDWRTGQLLKDL